MNFSNEPLMKSVEQCEITIEDVEDVISGDNRGLFVVKEDRLISELHFNCPLASVELHIYDKLSETPALSGNYKNPEELIKDIKSIN